MGIVDFKYKKISNFFTNDELILLKKYCKKRHFNNYSNFERSDLGHTLDTYFYKDPLMQVFLDEKKQTVEKEINAKLFSTYSYWRMYTFYAELKKHSDRPSCEISVTACIDHSGKEWPIYMGDNPIVLEPGDACIYQGTKILHERKEFYGEYNAQVFFHYVDQDGEYKNRKGDNNYEI